MKQILTLAAVLLLAAGCGNTVNWARPAEARSNPNWIEDERLVSDENLARLVAVTGLNTSLTAEGLLRVQVTLQSTSDKLRSIEYQFDWFDEAGMLVESPASRWTIEHIYGGDIKPITATAPSPKVTDFVFKMKRR